MSGMTESDRCGPSILGDGQKDNHRLHTTVYPHVLISLNIHSHYEYYYGNYRRVSQHQLLYL